MTFGTFRRITSENLGMCEPGVTDSESVDNYCVMLTQTVCCFTRTQNRHDCEKFTRRARPKTAAKMTYRNVLRSNRNQWLEV